MVTGDVADLMGVTAARVHQLDDVLRPLRRENGHRRYDPRRVLAVIKRRRRGPVSNPAPRSRAL
jgi:DNA-binding transcriptional MerR regulator